MVKIQGRIPNRGDIIQLELNPRTGSEQSGFRPAIVISPIAYNKIARLIIICPITSKQKGWPFEARLPEALKTHGVVLVDQVRAIDPVARKARFIEKSTVALLDEVLGKLETLTG
ncbi:MAG: type II toxin-antitoxin system PemK/MazF family toxin [Cyanobacteria bacterium P01_A01_bin.116]